MISEYKELANVLPGDRVGTGVASRRLRELENEMRVGSAPLESHVVGIFPQHLSKIYQRPSRWDGKPNGPKPIWY